MIANVLSIAGSDPSAAPGAGRPETFCALRCYGMAALTALTAQNTLGVTGVHVPPASFVAAQIDAIFADVARDAVKIGMLASGDIVEAVADACARTTALQHRARSGSRRHERQSLARRTSSTR